MHQLTRPARRAAPLLFLVLLLGGCATGAGRIGDVTDARALSERGLEQFEAGDYEAAIDSLDAVIDYGSVDDRDYTRRASAYAAQKKYAAALRDTDRALALAPDRWRTYLMRAAFNQKLGRYKEAIRDLDRAVALNPEEVELVRRRAYLNVVAGQFKQAAADYAHLQRLMPRSTTGATGRGVALYLAGDWPGAAAAFDEVLAMAPGDALAALWLVKASLRMPAPVDTGQFNGASDAEPEWIMVDALISGGSPDEVARTVAGLGQRDGDRHAVSACERALFLGAWRLMRINGDGAKREFEAAQKQCPSDSIEGAEAQAELSRLENK